MTAELTKIESNLLGLLEELNPDLDLKDESDLNEDTDKSDSKTDDEVTKEEAPKDEDKKE